MRKFVFETEWQHCSPVVHGVTWLELLLSFELGVGICVTPKGHKSGPLRARASVGELVGTFRKEFLAIIGAEVRPDQRDIFARSRARGSRLARLGIATALACIAARPVIPDPLAARVRRAILVLRGGVSEVAASALLEGRQRVPAKALVLRGAPPLAQRGARAQRAEPEGRAT